VRKRRGVGAPPARKTFALREKSRLIFRIPDFARVAHGVPKAAQPTYGDRPRAMRNRPRLETANPRGKCTSLRCSAA